MSDVLAMTDLAPFAVARYEFDLEAVDPLSLSAYHGSTLRGGFGYAFKKMVCAQADWRGCSPCQRGNECPYGYIFETSVPDGSEVLRNWQDVPAPFVIEPRFGVQRVAPGERLTFGLVLVGRAMQYLPYFLLAFQELGRMGLGKPPGRFVLQRIRAVHPWTGEQLLLFDGVDMLGGTAGLVVRGGDVAVRVARMPGMMVRLRFLTPARLKFESRVVSEVPFHVLVRSLLRRLSSLAYFHCGQRWEVDFRGLVTAAESVSVTASTLAWQDWERFSTRQQQRINLGGVMGEIGYRGALRPFLPLLALGEMVHVGKGAVFGNGRFEMVM